MKNLQIIKKYFQVTKANKKTTLLLIISSSLTNGPYLLTSLLFSLTINYLATKNQKMVLITMGSYFILKIFSKVFRIVTFHYEKKLYNDVYMKCQSKMVDKLDIINLKYFNEHSHSEVLNIVNSDIKILAEFGTWLSNAILLFISFIVSILILSKIKMGLMIFGCTINIIVIVILNVYNEKFEQLTRVGKTKSDCEMHFYSELLCGLKDIKIFNFLDPLRKLYQALNHDYLQTHDKQVSNKIISNIVSPSITMITEIILMTYACYNCIQGNFGIDTVLIIQSYFGTMFSSLSDFVTTLGELRVKNVSIERYHQFINTSISEPVTISHFCKLNNYELSFKDVAFSYPHQTILEQFNYTIKENSFVALTGKSGSGKSTLFNLLLRFETAKNGHITLGDHQINDYSKQQYPKLITCVSQQPFLFNLSIKDNLALVNDDFDKIKAACKKAEIDDFIMSLPQQYDTLIKENATNLSGGQRQRIAIARAILQDAKIILMDEITSALDAKTAKDIMDTVVKLRANHTIIMISHKESEVNLCSTLLQL